MLKLCPCTTARWCVSKLCVSKLWLSKPAAEACLELGADSSQVGRSATWCQGLQITALQQLSCVSMQVGWLAGLDLLHDASRYWAATRQQCLAGCEPSMQGGLYRALHRGVGCCGSRQSLFLAARNARGCHSQSSCVAAHVLSPAGTIQGLSFTCPACEFLCVRVTRGLLDLPNTA